MSRKQAADTRCRQGHDLAARGRESGRILAQTGLPDGGAVYGIHRYRHWLDGEAHNRAPD